MSYGERIKQSLHRCNRCGSCHSVCPIYAELKIESGSARGKIRLVKALRDGEFGLTLAVVQRLDLCLQCKQCTTNCPGGAEADLLIHWGRIKSQKNMGVPLFHRLVTRFFLSKRWIFDSTLAMGKLGQKILFRPGPNGKGMLPRIPFGLDMRRVVPSLSPQTLKQKLPILNKVNKPVARVTYFIGCMANLCYPQVGEALVQVLNHNNIEVVIPRLQHCCGMPIYASGDIEISRLMARENINVLSGLEADAIVVSCGSCGLALKEYYPYLFENEPRMKSKALGIAAKVKDVTEVLVSFGFAEGTQKVGCKVTYHDPCHLKNGLKVFRQPREILGSIPGLNYIENKEGYCCGSGGSFSLKHYNLSTKITERCLQGLMATRAEIIATGCLSCRMQLEDSIAQQGLNIQIRHTVELLAQSYCNKGTGNSNVFGPSNR